MTDRETRHRRVRGPVQAHYDAIVVGAGIGGLTAAALIAQAGSSVLVLDQHYVPGGNATLFRRNEWAFDVGLHYIGDCHPGGGMPRTLRQCGVNDVVFRPMDDDFEVMHFPDFQFRYSRDIDIFRERLIRAFPNERLGIDRYLRLLRAVWRVMSMQSKKPGLRKALQLAPDALLLRWALKPLGAFMDSCTNDERLQAVLCAQNGTYATAPGRVATALHMGLQAHYFASGGWYPEGGGQLVSDKLAESIESNGGDIRLKSDVTDIVVEDGRATGVRFYNKHLGECSVSAEHVVSNIDVKRLLRDVLPVGAWPQASADAIQSWDMALPLYAVFVGLDIPPEDLPWGNSNIWSFPAYDFDTYYARTRHGDDGLEKDPFIYIATASTKDPDNPELAPPGHTNLEIMTICPAEPAYWGLTEAEVADGSYSDNEAYLARKKAWTDACIRQMLRLYPQLEGHVVYEEGSSPFTHTRYVRSSGGTSYGFAMDAAHFFKRPPVNAPIDRLYICGANAQQGHGIFGAMASGKVAGRKVSRALADS